MLAQVGQICLLSIVIYCNDCFVHLLVFRIYSRGFDVFYIFSVQIVDMFSDGCALHTKSGRKLRDDDLVNASHLKEDLFGRSKIAKSSPHERFTKCSRFLKCLFYDSAASSRALVRSRHGRLSETYRRRPLGEN